MRSFKLPIFRTDIRSSQYNEEAQPCFERSLAELLALDDVVEYARTQEAYGLFFLARDSRGDLERGQELIRRAQETFKRLGVNG